MLEFNERYLTQINDGLTQTAACASAVAYDRENGLVFVSYTTGVRKHYGEATGKICVSVFPPAQPQNVRHRVLDTGVNASRGLLCTAQYLVGDARTRIMFTMSKGVKAAYTRDYDFLSDTVTPRREVLLRTDEGDVRLDNGSFRRYVAKYGYDTDCDESPMINKVSRYNGEFYTAVSLDGPSHPILCKIRDNVLIPFAICPELNTYEFRYYIDASGIYCVYRVAPDDHLTGHGGYTVSRDGGRTWETTIFEDGIQSRPDILSYNGKPLVIYNYKKNQSTENMPPMHNFRNSVKFVYDGKPVFDFFSKYGVVEHETVSIRGDLYMAFSNCPQALSYENGKQWIEDGHGVEQGKEAVQWIKLGWLEE